MKRILPCLLLLFLAAGAVRATVPAERVHAREAFAERGFGIFVHWGVYAVWGKGEWYLSQSHMPLADYEAKAAEFNPTNFDARAWAKAFKGAGARYVTITSRHHDGFSMFDTAQTDYDIVDATPFGRDPLKELSQACAEEGLALGFYYSLLDWRRPDYPRGSATDDYDSYFAFMTNQVSELLTGYGPVHCIWFDGEWDHNRTTGFDWRLGDFYDHIHRLQPSCLVGNNSHENLLDGEDFQIWEVNYPGGHSGAMNPRQTEIATNVPLECCWSTTDDAWGYNPDDAFEKMTYPEIVRRLVRTHAKGANLLLNVGPAPDGTIPPTVLGRLAAVGRWIDEYGHTVFGTVPSPYAVMATVATESADGKTVWLHSMPDSANANYGMWMAAYHTVVRATDLMTGKPLAFTQKPSGDKSMLSMTLHIPDGVPDYIVKLDVEPLQAPGDPAVEIVGIEPGTTNAEVCAFLRGTGGQTWGSVSAEFSTSSDLSDAVSVQLSSISGPGGVPGTIPGLAPATTYWVRLLLKAGSKPAVYSQTVSFTTLSTKAPPALGAAAVSTTKTNATLVVPVASLGDDGASVTVTATLGGATKTATLSAPGEATFVFEGLAADTEYAWSVSAVAAPSGLAAAPQSGVAKTQGEPKETKGWFFVDLSDEGYAAFPDVSGVAAPGGAWSGAEDFELAYSAPVRIIDFARREGSAETAELFYRPAKPTEAGCDAIVRGTTRPNAHAALPAAPSGAIGGLAFVRSGALLVPHGLAAGAWHALSPGVAQGTEVAWEAIFDFSSGSGPRVRYAIGATTNAWLSLGAGSALGAVGFRGAGAFGSFRGSYLKVVGSFAKPEFGAASADGSALGFGTDPATGRATFSVTIDNATDDADYAVYVCDTVDGDYVLDAAATQSGTGEFRTFTMADDDAAKFVKIVAAEPGYAFPRRFAEIEGIEQ